MNKTAVIHLSITIDNSIVYDLRVLLMHKTANIRVSDTTVLLQDFD